MWRNANLEIYDTFMYCDKRYTFINKYSATAYNEPFTHYFSLLHTTVKQKFLMILKRIYPIYRY